MFRAVVFVGLVGCSFSSVEPAGPRGEPCTRSYNAPVVDTVVGVPLAATGVAAATLEDDRGEKLLKEGSAVIGVPIALAGAIYLVSAMYGYVKVGNCRTARHGPR